MSLPRSAALALSAAALALASAPLSSQTIQINKENRTIAITATDHVTAMADTATLHIGYIVYGPDSDWAYASGSRFSNAIVEAVAGAGVSPTAIESDDQKIAPVPDYQNEKLSAADRAQRKFQLTQSWTVHTSPDDAAKVLDAAVKAGANQSGQIEWGLKDENATQAEAAAKALQRARAVASQMATGLNVKLGPLVYASNETQATPPQPLMRAMSAGALAMDKVAPLAINPRRIEKSATVYAIFAIE